MFPKIDLVPIGMRKSGFVVAAAVVLCICSSQADNNNISSKKGNKHIEDANLDR